jgi:hypothetical protein
MVFFPVFVAFLLGVHVAQCFPMLGLFLRCHQVAAAHLNLLLRLACLAYLLLLPDTLGWLSSLLLFDAVLLGNRRRHRDAGRHGNHQAQKHGASL